MPRVLLALLTALLLALSFPLTLPQLPLWLQAHLPYPTVADPALGSFSLPGLDTSGGYIQLSLLAFVALVPLLLAAWTSPRQLEAFKLGVLAGFVWLVLTLLWISNFGMTPVLLLAVYFALPLGLFAWLAHRLLHAPGNPQLRVARVLWGLPLIWVGIEYLRSFGLWSFPWNLLGYTQARYPLLVQSADTLGVYGVSFLVALANAWVVLLLLRTGKAEPRTRQAALAVLLAALFLGYGWWRLATADTAPEGAEPPPLTFALVQGGYSSLRLWNEESFTESLNSYVQPTRALLGKPDPYAGSLSSGGSVVGLGAISATSEISSTGAVSVPQLVQPDTGAQPATAEPAPPDPAELIGPTMPPQPEQRTPAPSIAPVARGGGDLLVVWPESCISKPGGMDPRRSGTIPPELTALLYGHADTALLLGAMGMPHADQHPENGCLLLEAGQPPHWPYSKVRLVPYGEVTPFRNLVTFLELPWDFGRDLSAGADLTPVRWREHALGVQICFDNLFPFLARKQAQHGAQYLLLLTNNSWYPMRSGVRQHADLDILRAVETRRPLVRVSTTGWSQSVDRAGRVTASTEVVVGQPRTLAITPRPGSGTTPYMLVGDLFAQLALLAALVFALPPLLLVRSEGFL